MLPKSSATGELDHLTGMRGIAALLVAFHHIAEYIDPYIPTLLSKLVHNSYLAVDFFFVLSGFIIAYTYTDNFKKYSTPALKAFYIKRIARIYPLHLLIWLGYLSIPLAFYATGRVFSSVDRYSIDGYFWGLTLMHNWGWLDQLQWNIPSWSISTELLAYLFFPPIIVVVNRSYQAFGRPIVLLLIFLCLSLLSYFYAINDSKHIGDNIERLGFLRCLLEFFSGVCIWKLFSSDSGELKKSANIVLLIGISATLFAGDLQNYYYAPLVIMCIFVFTLYDKVILFPVFSKPLLVWLGEISYSIYLVHFLVKDWFKLIFIDEAGVASPLWIAGYIITVLVISNYLYRLFEIPCKKYIVNKLT